MEESKQTKGTTGQDIMEEETLYSESIFQGKVISLQVDTVRLPNGKSSTREIVKHPGAVAVLAITDDGKIPVLRQYRAACGEVLLEIPAGKLERGEAPELAAKRELEEETGYCAKEWVKLISIYTSPGFANEIIHLYAAKGLTSGKQNLDEDEFLDVELIDKPTAKRWLMDGSVRDAKTAWAFLWWLSQEN